MSLMLRPASGPLTKHFASASSAAAASACTDEESKAKWAVGMLPQARRILSSMCTDPLVGDAVSCRGGGGAALALPSVAAGGAGGPWGSGFGSELQAAAQARAV